jgi:hypothetical protein
MKGRPLETEMKVLVIGATGQIEFLTNGLAATEPAR